MLWHWILIIMYKRNLRSSRFISQKKFFSNYIGDIISFKGKSSFKPIIGENYFYGYAGIGLDYYMLTAEMKCVENIMDREIIKVYIQFKDFFLIKGYDEVIYIIDNNEFKDKLNEPEFPILILQALKNEKFFKFHTRLINIMLKESMKIKSYNENICIGFEFNSVFFGVNFDKMLIKQYHYVFNNNDTSDLVDVYVFKDIILVHDIANNCLSVYENIFSLYIIKDKDLFYNELLNLINLYYKKYN